VCGARKGKRRTVVRVRQVGTAVRGKRNPEPQPSVCAAVVRRGETQCDAELQNYATNDAGKGGAV